MTVVLWITATLLNFVCPALLDTLVFPPHTISTILGLNTNFLDRNQGTELPTEGFFRVLGINNIVVYNSIITFVVSPNRK